MPVGVQAAGDRCVVPLEPAVSVSGADQPPKAHRAVPGVSEEGRGMTALSVAALGVGAAVAIIAADKVVRWLAERAARMEIGE